MLYAWVWSKSVIQKCNKKQLYANGLFVQPWRGEKVPSFGRKTQFFGGLRPLLCKKFLYKNAIKTYTQTFEQFFKNWGGLPTYGTDCQSLFRHSKNQK